MKRQYSFILVLIMFLAGTCYPVTPVSAQNTGIIKGKITDEKGEEIGGAQVILLQNNKFKAGRETDLLDGTYKFDTLQAGTYEIKVMAIGYLPKIMTGITVKAGKTTVVNVNVTASAMEMSQVEIIAFKKPLFEKDQTTSGGTIHNNNNKTSNAQKIKGRRDKKERYNAAPEMLQYVPPVQSGEFNTEEYGHTVENGWKKSTEDPLSTFSIDVDVASYSNIRRFLNNGQMPPKDAVRIEEMINYFKYNYPRPAGKDPFSVTTEVSGCPWNKNHRLVHIGMKGKEIAVDKLPASNLVFLIDVSGSMMDQNKLPLVKSSLRLLVDQIREQDKVAIVVYAGAAGLVLPSANGNEKEKIIAAIEGLQAGGSTAGGAGIQLAYKVAKENFREEGNNRVILCTDGDFNVGASSDGELVRMVEEKRKDGIFLTVLGYGMGNYKDRKMEQLADKGNGNYAYIDNLMEAKKVLVSEFGGTLFTIAKDVKLQVEWNPAQVKGYRLIGYENRILNKEDFNDDKKDAGELGAGHTVTALYEIIPANSEEEISGKVDELKYQEKPGKINNENATATSNEVLTVKLRYKKPDENKSILLSQVLKDKDISFESAAENLRWSATVASFGMLLRESEYKGDSSFEKVIAWAKAAKGKDEEGYRAEFIRLAEMASLLNKGQGRK